MQTAEVFASGTGNGSCGGGTGAGEFSILWSNGTRSSGTVAALFSGPLVIVTPRVTSGEFTGGQSGSYLQDHRGVARGAPAPGDEARANLVRHYDAARAAHDVDAMADAALDLAAMQVWGTVPGRLPAFLYEAYRAATGPRRAQLAVAITRAWVYSGHPAQAAPFAAEALADAEQRHDPAALAAALDASLLAHWGPDDLVQRARLAARLEDVVAHVTDVEARMSAYLWRLTTALEALDGSVAVRQLRALDVLAVEFLVAAGGLLRGVTPRDACPAPRRRARGQGGRRGGHRGWSGAGEPDTLAIHHALTAAIARHEGDAAVLAAEAAVFEEFGLREGATAVAAEAAMLWQAAGIADRAESLLLQVAAPGADGSAFATLTRDVEWLLTIVSLTEVAAALGVRPLCEAAVALLEPYSGRGVVNAGAVGFVGVVDDYLARAAGALGRHDQSSRWRATAAGAYARIGATWWGRRTVSPAVARMVEARPAVVHLRPSAGAIWWVGREDATVAVRDSKGLHYLRMLLASPGVDVPAIVLSDAVAGGPTTGVIPQAGLEVLDRTALISYRRRLADIDAELDEAAAWSDAGRLEALAAERDALLAEVRAATGLGGRQRRTGAAQERARIAVRKAVATAIDRIGQADAELGRLLMDTVRTGAACRYEPDPHRPVIWVLQERGP